MIPEPIDCIQAVYYRNQRAPLTVNEKMALESHLASCRECREEQICCDDALELIDRRSPVEESEAHALHLHLSCCPDCCAAQTIETSLRSVIAPGSIPSPSIKFEDTLAAKLSIAPISAKATKATNRDVEFDRITLWSWISISLTGALIGALQLPKVFGITGDLPDLYRRTIGFLASYLTGESAIVYSFLTRPHTALPVDSLALIMGLTLVVIGWTAARSAFEPSE